MTDADALTEALTHEQGIADEAAEIRGDAKELTPALFMELWPLLKRPIPAAFIQTVGKTQGKPYESTGIRSVQVQVDRMNNVLTPMWWWDHASYEEGGKLAFVTVMVGNRKPGETPDEILAVRRSSGGVDRGSTIGNVHKGSYTNAAKLAFARLGIGHEVYVGATDLDPDVDADLASQTDQPVDAEKPVGNGIAGKLVDRIWAVPAAKDKARLAISHAANGDVGEVNTKPKAKKVIAALNFQQAERLDRWISGKESGDDGDQ